MKCEVEMGLSFSLRVRRSNYVLTPTLKLTLFNVPGAGVEPARSQ